MRCTLLVEIDLLYYKTIYIKTLFKHYLQNAHRERSGSVVQTRKTRPFITERLLMGRKESNQSNKQNAHVLKKMHGCIKTVHVGG